MIKKLTQKLHGLPGIPQIKANDGADGTQGNNIYFGNISDFFDSIEVAIDNFVRMAQTKQTVSYNTSSPYYTGIFERNSLGKLVDSEEIVPRTYNSIPAHPTKSESSLSAVLTDKNIFQNIYDIEGYTDTDGQYPYTYDDEEHGHLNLRYIKVDITRLTVNPHDAESGTNAKVKWRTDSTHTQPDPFVTISGKSPLPNPSPATPENEWFDYMPGRNNIGRIDGNSLFSISDNGKNYTYSTLNNKYKSRQYESFDEYNKTNRNDLSNYDSVSIYDLIDNYNAGVANEKIDYVKYAPKAVQTVSFTDKLREDIKAGDIIYFYTDLNVFEYDMNVEYMVVIDKSLERCTIDELLAKTTIADPFTFKYVDEIKNKGNNYIQTTNKITAVYYDLNASGDTEMLGHNFSNFITYGSDSVLNIGSISEQGGEISDNVVLMSNDSKITFSSQQLRSENNSINQRHINALNGNNEQVPLKITNPKFKNHNKGNIEVSGCFDTKHIVMEGDYCFTLREGQYNSVNNSFIINKSDIINDEDFEDFRLSVLQITYDSSKEYSIYTESEDCHIKKYFFRNQMVYKIPLTEDFGENTAHIITLSISEEGGMVRQSKHTLAKFDKDINSYVISMTEDNESVENTDDYDNRVFFVPHGISADEIKENYFDIYIPYNVLNEEELIPMNIQIFINSKELSKTSSYQNSWCTITYDEISESDRKVMYNNKYCWHERCKVDMDDNIPQAVGITDITKVSDYIKTLGSGSQSDGCDLFSAMVEGKDITTKQRSVLITVKYNVTQVTTGKLFKSFYKLTQPGFVETRKMPKVNISIDKSIRQLESANNIENGVLCNQFLFFVNVDISDFSKEIWNTYQSEDDITLNFDIKNVPVDYDFIKKYSIEAADNTYMMHVYNTDEDKDSINNLYSIKTMLIDNDVDDPYNKTQAELDNSHIEMVHTNNAANDILNTINQKSISIVSEYGNNIEKIYESGNALFNEPNNRASGLNDSVTIQFRDITFSKAALGRFRFRVVVEIANPVFTYLFFRYYVSNIWIRISDKNYYVGSNNLASLEQSGRLSMYNYMYSTDTLNVFLCPVSMTAIPNKAYSWIDTKDNQPDGVMIQGSDEQNKVGIDKYVPNIEKVDDKLSVYSLTRQIPWPDFSLKKRYFQDSTKNIYIKPIHIDDIKDKISLLEAVNAYNQLGNFETTSKDMSYMSLLYNASYYNKMMRKDKYTFYYNQTLYEASKYDQFNNKMPIYIELDAVYEVRDDKLSTSVDTWNHEYKILNITDNGLFLGNNSMYGNGYMYLPDTLDKSQYDEKKTYSLSDTKKLNEETIFNGAYYFNAKQLAKTTQYNPNIDAYFRKLLYQCYWKYPKHYINESNQLEYIDAYKLCDLYEYLNDYRTKHIIPYNLLYSIYPRCAYDDENDTVIVFMLRKPSVCKENQYEMKVTDFLFDMTGASYNQLNDTENKKLNVLR